MSIVLLIIIVLVITAVTEGFFIHTIMREYRKLILKVELLEGIIEVKS